MVNIFNMFKKSEPSSIIQLIKQIGFNPVSDMLALIVMSKFSNDIYRNLWEIEHFLRCEADAMYQAGGELRSYTKNLFPDKSYFLGALKEDDIYNIDRINGPQQTIIIISDLLFKESNDRDIPAGIRLDIVRKIALWQASLQQQIVCYGNTNEIQDNNVHIFLKDIKDATSRLINMLNKDTNYFHNLVSNNEIYNTNIVLSKNDINKYIDDNISRLINKVRNNTYNDKDELGDIGRIYTRMINGMYNNKSTRERDEIYNELIGLYFFSADINNNELNNMIIKYADKIYNIFKDIAIKVSEVSKAHDELMGIQNNKKYNAIEDDYDDLPF